MAIVRDADRKIVAMGHITAVLVEARTEKPTPISTPSARRWRAVRPNEFRYQRYGCTGKRRPPASGQLSLAALGVVFGDIGTSPLYAIRECFHGEYGIPVTHANVLGVLSLMFWSLVMIVPSST